MLNKEILRDLFIFEMANNHQGSVDHGVDIISEIAKISRKHNIKAGVKLQYRDLDSFIHPDFRNRDDIKHIQRFLSTRLSPNEYQLLVNKIVEENLIPICTPFDEESVSLCLDHGIRIIKVASCSTDDWPLLTEIAAANKPVIISTAGTTLSGIDKIYNFFTHRDVNFALMHCIGLYPTPDNIVQMDFIERLKNRYPHVPIGYSGHEAPDNYNVVKVAVAKNVDILERHVGIETDAIKLNSYSMNPEQVNKWVESAIKAKEISKLKNPDKYIRQEEIDSLNSLKRGIYAARSIEKGEVISREDVFFAMPLQKKQTKSGDYNPEMVASKHYEANEPVLENSKEDIIKLVRTVIHDFKGMFFESKIPLGNNFAVELSHHYGMERFRQYGALLINMVNREYCKKYIAVLPSQEHPVHHHKIKEETFQLLYGDLQITLAGKKIEMKPGDIVVVERGVPHSFTSVNGAIFEEISTTHVKDDSYYEDQNIACLDPIIRKTILENW